MSERAKTIKGRNTPNRAAQQNEELKRLKEENARLRDPLNFVQTSAREKYEYY